MCERLVKLTFLNKKSPESLRTISIVFSLAFATISGIGKTYAKPVRDLLMLGDFREIKSSRRRLLRIISADPTAI